MAGPLEGIRVIDMTTVLMGPYLTQILGDLGADIIKVEPPAGDSTRQLPPARHAQMGPIFLQANRNKRSLVLDLKKPGAIGALLGLAAGADCLVSNIRPLALERLGLTRAVLEKANPRLISLSLVGYGQTGPYAADPAYDDLIQGLTAMPSMLVEAGSPHPHYVPLAYNDRGVATHAGMQLLAALIHRQRTGEGQHIEVPMFETMVEAVWGDHSGGFAFEPPAGPPGYRRQLNPQRRPFETLDGYVCVLIYNDKQWRSFARLIGRPKLREEDARFTDMRARTDHAEAVYGFVGECMLSKTTDDWLALLREADIPAARLHTLESLAEDPHLTATGFFSVVDHPSEGQIRQMAIPSTWSKSQPEIRRQAPRLGEHSMEILKEAGLGDADIAQLMAAGATAGPDRKPD